MKKFIIITIIAGLLNGVASAKELTTSEKDAAIAVPTIVVGGALVTSPWWGTALYNKNVYHSFLKPDGTLFGKYSNSDTYQMWKGSDGLRYLLQQNGTLVRDFSEIKTGDTYVVSRATFGKDISEWNKHSVIFNVDKFMKRDNKVFGTKYEVGFVNTKGITDLKQLNDELDENMNIVSISELKPGNYHGYDVDKKAGAIIQKDTTDEIDKIKYFISKQSVYKVNLSKDEIDTAFRNIKLNDYNSALYNCNHCTYDVIKNAAGQKIKQQKSKLIVEEQNKASSGGELEKPMSNSENALLTNEQISKTVNNDTPAEIEKNLNDNDEDNYTDKAELGDGDDRGLEDDIKDFKPME